MSGEEMIYPSDAEEEATSRLALRAAMKELDGIVWHKERKSPAAVLQILKAMRAIKQELRKSTEVFLARNPGKKCSPFPFYHLSEMEILASAYYACGNEVDEAEMSPACIAGRAILDFAAAIVLINAVSEATTILDDGSDAMFGGEGAEIILDYVSSS